MTLCEWEKVESINPQPLTAFDPFFNVYDQLNNPIFLRQIGQIIQERVLHDRNDPRALMYCVMRVLRLSDKELRFLVESMDDQTRW